MGAGRSSGRCRDKRAWSLGGRRLAAGGTAGTRCAPAASLPRVAASSRSLRLAVVPGDGIGPEVVAEGLRVLRAVAPAAGVTVDAVE